MTDHEEIMKTLEHKRRNAMMLIALVAASFAAFLLLRPLLKAYL